MTAAAPAAGDQAAVEELRRYAADLRRYADSIETALATTTHVSGSLAAAWADAAGREWADRLQLVGRELARQADAAHELARSAERTVADLLDAVGDLLGTRVRGVSPDPGTAPAPAGAGSARDTDATDRAPDGVRLGGLDGSRVGRQRGVVVPTLPDPGG